MAKMTVPLLDLKQQLIPLRDEILQEVTSVIDSTQYILGPIVEELESEVAAYCGARHGVGVSSGTDALIATLLTMDIGTGDFVITTPYTFIATLGCILRRGALPLFVDIDPVSFNISVDRVAELLEGGTVPQEKIKAILPVHLYGQCADMNGLIAISEKYQIPLIEDAAQAIGAACPVTSDKGMQWKKAGSMGLAGCFSFFPSKNLGGVGDGGMVITNDDEMAAKLKIIRVHGGAPKYHHAVLGGNFRLDPIQAAVLRVKLPHLENWHESRRQNAAYYNRLFSDSGLPGQGLITPPATVYETSKGDDLEHHRNHHIYNQYVIRAERRDALRAFLQDEGVATEIYYPIALHKQKCLADQGYNSLEYPEAEKAAAESLALPIYPELTKEMQDYVVEKIIQFYQA